MVKHTLNIDSFTSRRKQSWKRACADSVGLPSPRQRILVISDGKLLSTFRIVSERQQRLSSVTNSKNKDESLVDFSHMMFGVCLYGARTHPNERSLPVHVLIHTESEVSSCLETSYSSIGVRWWVCFPGRRFFFRKTGVKVLPSWSYESVFLDTTSSEVISSLKRGKNWRYGRVVRKI